MKTYVGSRHGGCAVFVRTDKGSAPLRLRLDLRKHSPAGFEWGYGGSGPAQLALALLADCLCDDHRAVALHQDFKFKIVSNLNPQWQLTEDEVKSACTAIEAERAVKPRDPNRGCT